MQPSHSSDSSDSPGASALATALWVIVILLGSSGVQEPLIYFAPAATPLLTLLWLGLYAIALFALLRQSGVDWLIWLLRFRLLILLVLLVTMGSALWAIDAKLSMQRSVHLLGSCTLAIYAGFFLNIDRLLSTLLWTASALLALSIAAVFTLPELSVQAYEGDQVWRGVFANKNTLGFWSTMTLMLALFFQLKEQTLGNRLLLLSCTLMALLALYESKSATSVVALIAGCTVTLILSACKKLQLSMVQQALLSVLGLGTVLLLLQAIDTHWLNALLGRSGNLTGRSEVWAQTTALIMERPFSGYGYGNLWNPTEDSMWIQQNHTNFSWIVYHAHNGLLQVASEIGLFMAAVTAMYLAQQLLESIHSHNQLQTPTSLFVIAFSVAFLLSNYSEARLLINRDIFWILYLAMPISLLRFSAAPRPGEAALVPAVSRAY